MDLALTSRDVRRIVKRVMDKIDDKSFSSSVLALFVGNWCDTPVIVPAPVVPGVLYWRSVDELDVRMLMVRRGEYSDVRPPMFITPYLLRPIVERSTIKAVTAENQASIGQATRALRRHALWRILDLRWTVFESMGILTLYSLSGTCRTMRRWVQQFYRARVSRMLSNAFDEKVHASFLNTLEEFDGKIGGSAAYSVADPCAPIAHNDINILVPYGSGRSLCCQLIQDFGCSGQTAGNEDLIRARFDAWLDNFYVLHTETGFKLTISESESSSHLPLMLAGNSTAECVLLGSQNFTLIFPSLVEHGDVICMHAMGYTIPADVFLRLQRRWSILESTEELNRPCGYGRGAENEVQWGSYEWKISFDCRNFFCDNPRPFEMSRWLCWEERAVEEEEQEEEGQETENGDDDAMDTTDI
ncbi:hypothetical protein C8R42DRAFT_640781 [Lentinula raphanica]|nr:hypothetical protein C8R42DRAFT_640781 [Lentinula raphanica]